MPTQPIPNPAPGGSAPPPPPPIPNPAPGTGSPPPPEDIDNPAPGGSPPAPPLSMLNPAPGDDDPPPPEEIPLFVEGSVPPPPDDIPNLPPAGGAPAPAPVPNPAPGGAAPPPPASIPNPPPSGAAPPPPEDVENSPPGSGGAGGAEHVHEPGEKILAEPTPQPPDGAAPVAAPPPAGGAAAPAQPEDAGDGSGGSAAPPAEPENAGPGGAPIPPAEPEDAGSGGGVVIPPAAPLQPGDPVSGALTIIGTEEICPGVMRDESGAKANLQLFTGRALALNGANTYLTRANIVPATPPITFTCRLKNTALSGVLIDTRTSEHVGFSIWRSAENRIEVKVNGNMVSFIDSAKIGLLRFGCHIAVTWDGITCALYVNGDLVGSGALTGTPTHGATVCLFSRNYGAPIDIPTGYASEARMWAAILTHQEIRDEVSYPQKNPVRPASLVFWLPLRSGNNPIWDHSPLNRRWEAQNGASIGGVGSVLFRERLLERSLGALCFSRFYNGRLSITQVINTSGHLRMRLRLLWVNPGPLGGAGNFWIFDNVTTGASGSGMRVSVTPQGFLSVSHYAAGSQVYTATSTIPVPSNTYTEIILTYSSGSQQLTVNIDGQSQNLALQPQGLPTLPPSFGSADANFQFSGVLYEVAIDRGNNGVFEHEWINTGNTLADWQDKIGTAHVTSISPPLGRVGDLMLGWPQCAHENLEVRMHFDGVDDWVRFPTAPNLAASYRISLLFFYVPTGTVQRIFGGFTNNVAGVLIFFNSTRNPCVTHYYPSTSHNTASTKVPLNYEVNELIVIYNHISGNLTITLNGLSDTFPGKPNTGAPLPPVYIGHASNTFRSLILRVKVDVGNTGVWTNQWTNKGVHLNNWRDEIGAINSDLINGSPAIHVARYDDGVATGKTTIPINLIRPPYSLNMPGESSFAQWPFAVPAGDFTLEAWAQHAGVAPTLKIIDGSESATSGPRLVAYEIPVIQRVFGALVDAAAASQSFAHVPRTWHHVAMVMQSGSYRLYVDGFAHAAIFEPPAVMSAYVRLAGGYVGNDAWIGPLAKPAIFRRALSASEILARYEKNKALYPFTNPT